MQQDDAEARSRRLVQFADRDKAVHVRGRRGSSMTTGPIAPTLACPSAAKRRQAWRIAAAI